MKEDFQIKEWKEIPNEARPKIRYWMPAAAAHLGRKKRYSFECAAEFGHSYGQDYEDLFWWIKRALMSGMNAQVLHGGSYSGAYYGPHSVDGNLPGVEWPGFEGFGKFVSNYWNRTLLIEDARGCLDTVARMNALFLKQARVDCAIYRQSYSNSGIGSEFCFYPDDGLLMNSGYSYETVSPALLSLPVCRVKDGLLDADGVGYQCLIVPEQEWVSAAFLEKVQELLADGFPVFWIGRKPESGRYYTEWRSEEQRQEWRRRMEAVWRESRLIHVASLQEVPAVLSKHGIFPRTMLSGSGDVMTALHIEGRERDNGSVGVAYHMLYAYNRVRHGSDEKGEEENQEFMQYNPSTIKPGYRRSGRRNRREISVSLLGEGNVYQCNPWNGKLALLPASCRKGRTEVTVSIEEDELVILALVPGTGSERVEKGQLSRRIPLEFQKLTFCEFLPDQEESGKHSSSFLRSHFAEKERVLDLTALAPEQLRPWRSLEPSLEHFAGYGVYHVVCQLDSLDPDAAYRLHLARVSDTFQVKVNGTMAPFPDQVLKEADLTGLLHPGCNQLEIRVTTNLYNRLVGELAGRDNRPAGLPGIEYRPRDYGVWNTELDRCEIYEID